MSNDQRTKEEQRIADFLGVRVLTPLEEDMAELSGGATEQHDHDNNEHHDQVYKTTPGHNTQ